MDRFEITKEMLVAANDYVALEKKEVWAANTAPKCFNKLSITADEDPMPPMYSINTGLKARYLMAAFADFYLKQEFETEAEDDTLMTVEAYDGYAGGHVFNQLERWKADKEVRDKCFDLLADYKDLEKEFSSQLYSLLNVQNDFVLRQTMYSEAQMKQLPQLMEQLKKMQEEKKDGDTAG